jgi:hypothetical protein
MASVSGEDCKDVIQSRSRAWIAIMRFDFGYGFGYGLR